MQEAFGWQANFYFLGGLTFAILVLDRIFGGESLQEFQRFEAKPIIGIYRSMIKTADFSLGLIMIGLSYSMLMVYGMTSPFIIEHVFNQSPVVTGYSSLLSGVALMLGGVISKSIISKPLDRKIPVAIALQFVFAISMIAVSHFYASNLFTLLFFVVLLNITAGFIFNNLFAYSLGRFPKNAGILSGLTGGGLFVITSILSYGAVSILSVKNQALLGVTYLVFIVLNALVFTLFQKYRYNAQRATVQAATATATMASEPEIVLEEAV